MELHGTQIYLTIGEQRESEYSSPIDISTFPLHEERSSNDAELDRLEALQMLNADQLTHAERASLPKDLERAHKKSKITREIAKITSTHSLVYGDPSSRQ